MAETGFAKKLASVRSVFVGREREIAELEAGLEDAISGRGNVFLLVGEPGVGKTRLADEIALRADARGILTLWGRCWDGSDAPVYWPWTQIIRSYLTARDLRDVQSELGPIASGVLQLVPELGEPAKGRGSEISRGYDDSERARFQLFDAVASFFRRVSREEPLVLVLDDLHVADSPSFLLLEFLARDLRGARLLIVGTYRDVEARRTPELSRVLGSLAREGRYLAVHGLGEADVGAFISVATGNSPRRSVVRAVYRATEGNPFFVDEMVRFLAAEGRLHNSDGLRTINLGLPQGIREAIRRRVEVLSENTKQVLSIASVVGREFGLKLLAKVSGFDVDQLLEALREAEMYEIVSEAPMALGHYSFAHVLVRDTLYYECPLGRRMELHQRIGEVLESLHGDDRESRLPNLAHHFFEAIDRVGAAKAIAYCVEAANLDTKLHAYAEAAEHYRRALEALAFNPPVDEACRFDLLIGLGEAQWRAGETSESRATFERAADLGKRLGDRERFARAALGVATGPGGLHLVYRPDAALVSLLEEALEAVGRQDGVLRARLVCGLTEALHFNSNGAAETRMRLVAEATEMAARLRDPATRLATLYSSQLSMLGPDGLEARIEAAEEIQRLAAELGDRAMMFHAHHLHLVNFLEVGNIEAVDEEIEACGALAESLRQPFFEWQADVSRAMRSLTNGRVAAAERLTETALEAGEPAQCEAAAHVFATQRFIHGFTHGRLDELESSVKANVERFPWITASRAALAFLHSRLGREGETRSEFERLASKDFADLRGDENWYAGMWFLAMTCGYLRDAERAAILYDRLLPYAERCFVAAFGAVNLGSVSSALGLLASTAGHPQEAERHFEVALRRNAEMENQPFHVLTLVQYAEMLLVRDGVKDADQARILATRAVELAEALGMRGLKADAERLAAAVQGAYQKRRNAFYRAGDHWTISFEGKVFHLKDSIGLRYIAYLLRNPGKKIPAPEIVLFADGVQADSIAANLSPREVADLGVRHGGFGDAGEMLDSQAEQAYRRRFEELEAALGEAKSFNDLGRIQAITEEQDFLLRELSAGFGLGGRSRRAASFAERARLNVTRAIKSAVERIAEHSRSLGTHLKASIDTGKACVYTSDPSSPTPWIF